MNRVMKILKNEQGQGMLEYIIAICGAVAIAAAAMTVLKADGNNATNSVVKKINNTKIN